MCSIEVHVKVMPVLGRSSWFLDGRYGLLILLSFVSSRERNFSVANNSPLQFSKSFETNLAELCSYPKVTSVQRMLQQWSVKLYMQC